MDSKILTAEFWNTALMQWGPKLLLAILTLIVGLWLIKRVTNMLQIRFAKNNVDPSAYKFLVSLVNVTLKVLLFFTVASMFGVKTTSFIAIAAAASFAIGTALSGSLAHFASGVLILIFKPYKVGDLVKLGDYTGHVDEIQTFNTILITPDNKKIIIPNSIVTSNPIVNISGSGLMRVDHKFSTGAGVNIDQVRQLILGELAKNSKILKDPQATVNVTNLTPISVDYDVHTWINPDDYWAIYFGVQEEIKKLFIANNIAGPQPNMEVFMKQTA